MGLAIAQNFNSHNSDHVQIQSGHSTTLRVMTLNKCKSKGGGGGNEDDHYFKHS